MSGPDALGKPTVFCRRNIRCLVVSDTSLLAVVTTRSSLLGPRDYPGLWFHLRNRPTQRRKRRRDEKIRRRTSNQPGSGPKSYSTNFEKMKRTNRAQCSGLTYRLGPGDVQNSHPVRKLRVETIALDSVDFLSSETVFHSLSHHPRSISTCTDP